jgi:hypothetical protein
VFGDIIMDNNKKIVKEDINFLEYPNWILHERSRLYSWVIEKQSGRYEIASLKGLPTHFDKIVLYFLLYKLYKLCDFGLREFETTRYEIAKNIFADAQNLSSNRFDRIMLALEKWKAIFIKFEGVFYEGDNYTVRYFSVLDDVIWNQEKRTLLIRFNQQYIQQLEESKFYKLIDFEEYKKLTRSVSARLYEILVKNFKERNIWHVGIQNLAEKLTLEKRSVAKDYYPSDVLIKLRPAINEINKNTGLKIDFVYDALTSLCVFKTCQDILELAQSMSVELPLLEQQEDGHLIQAAQVVALYEHERGCERELNLLAEFSISKRQAKMITEKYSYEKIQRKIDLLKQSKQAVKNRGAWLLRALEEDWDIQAYNKQLEEQKAKTEATRKHKEQEELRRKLEALKVEYDHYKESKALELYNVLPAKVAKNYDKQFDMWLKEQKQKSNGFAVHESIYRTKFLIDMLLDEDDLNFEKWALSRGYKLEKVGSDYHLIS